ncbi:MAG: CHAT domain-containing protein, partial [Myxococcota bacterium]
DEGFVKFGLLEPLLRSPVPALIGTLWDINPPSDGLFVRTFYQEISRGNGPLGAIHRARSAVSTNARWAPVWPAYVLVGR